MDKLYDWNEVRSAASPAAIAAAEAGAAEIVASLRLGALRRARGLTQEEMAERLEIRQVSVSKLESRADVRISTLQGVVEAMGGELEIHARFPDGAEYRIVFGEETEVEPIAPRGPPGRAAPPNGSRPAAVEETGPGSRQARNG